MTRRLGLRATGEGQQGLSLLGRVCPSRPYRLPCKEERAAPGQKAVETKAPEVAPAEDSYEGGERKIADDSRDANAGNE